MAGWTEAIEALGALASTLGIVVGITAVLDFLLSETQKALIADKLLIYWNWLDDNRSLAPLRRFQSSAVHTRVVGFITLAYVALAATLYLIGGINGPALSICLVGAFLASAAFKRMHGAIEWMINPSSVLAYLFRSSIVFSSVIVVSVALGLIVSVVNIAINVGLGFTGPATYVAGDTIFVSVTFLPVYVILIFVVLQGYYWGATLLYGIIVGVLLIISPVMRLIVMRAIEYPKGPVAAISVLLTAMGALVAKIAGPY